MTTDLVEKCVRAARRIEHRGCCTGAALEDTVNMPISVRERECILAVIDALADGVSDEMIVAFTMAYLQGIDEPEPEDRVRHELASEPSKFKVPLLAIRAAIRAAKSREG